MHITQHRLTITFFIAKRARAKWTIDAFKSNGTTFAVRCYQWTIHGNERRLQDGWLAYDQANIAAAREEITKIMKSKNVRVEREPPSEFKGKLADIRL